MKKIIGFTLAWSLYYLGHWTSLLMKKYDVGFSFYSWCMVTSADIQDWAKLSKPWEEPTC